MRLVLASLGFVVTGLVAQAALACGGNNTSFERPIRPRPIDRPVVIIDQPVENAAQLRARAMRMEQRANELTAQARLAQELADSLDDEEAREAALVRAAQLERNAHTLRAQARDLRTRAARLDGNGGWRKRRIPTRNAAII
jgi:hypothetical protein